MKQILVVDDDRGARTLISIILERAGYHPIMAESAEEALSTLQQETPDLIMLDIMMPGIDGIELCQKLRSEPATATLPILILSTLRNSDAVVRSMDAGATDYLSKPILHLDLVTKVKSLLSMDTPVAE